MFSVDKSHLDIDWFILKRLSTTHDHVIVCSLENPKILIKLISNNLKIQETLHIKIITIVINKFNL